MAPLSQASMQALARLRAYVPPPTNYFALPLSRRAAVLIVLFADRHGNLRVVLTERSSTLNSYAGQVAFPGGRADSLDETPFQTARREAYEEIGLPSDDQKLPAPFRLEQLCELPAHVALTELGVRPCVSFLNTGDSRNGNGPNAEESLIPRLEAKEVSAVFSAPFHSFLLERDETEDDPEEASKWYQGSWGMWNYQRWRMHNFYIPSDRKAKGPSKKRYRAFGLTATMLVDAARVAYGEDPQFEFNSSVGEEGMLRKLMDMGRLNADRKPEDRLTPEVLAKAAKI